MMNEKQLETLLASLAEVISSKNTEIWFLKSQLEDTRKALAEAEKYLPKKDEDKDCPVAANIEIR